MLSQFTLARLALGSLITGLSIGFAFTSKNLLEAHRMNSQIAQIAAFDHAVADFHQKYGGLPGDLIAVKATREGLPAGDGTPSHSDGDGKISPCNPGMQWMLGCETALFWTHLSVSEMLQDNFTADSRLANSRLSYVDSLSPYLPESPLKEGVYVTVWNSDASTPSLEPRLPYGNYYEITTISGLSHEKIIDEVFALTPAQAYAIDKKTDDGMPLTGRVLVNQGTDWPKESWGTYAKPGAENCVAEDGSYNTRDFLHAHAPLCHLAVGVK